MKPKEGDRVFMSKIKYKACIYARLSKDDGDDAKKESNSISNHGALDIAYPIAHHHISDEIKLILGYILISQLNIYCQSIAWRTFFCVFLNKT